MTDRDSIDRAVLPTDQIFVRTDVVPPGVPIAGNNEWLLIQTSNPSGPTAVSIPLRGSNGQQVLAGEPFYVAGLQTFQNLTSTSLYVSRAPRRELLSDGFSGKEFPSNGAGMSDLLNGFNFGPFSLAATEWAYLYLPASYLTNPSAQPAMRIATAGTVQAGDLFPFGWFGDVPEWRGRYYNIEFYTGGTGGSQTVEIAHDLSGQLGPLYIGPAISAQRSSPYGHCSVGDSESPNLLGPSFVVSNYSQQRALGSRRWTLAIRPASALTLVQGTFHVNRQGF